jgi:RNA polymerase primary sigma factor
MAGEKYAAQYDSDRSSALLIEQGISEIQRIIAGYPIALKFIFDLICTNPSDNGIVSYKYDPAEQSLPQIKFEDDIPQEYEQPVADPSSNAEELNQALAALISNFHAGNISSDVFTEEFIKYRLCFDILEKTVRMLINAAHHNHVQISSEIYRKIEDGRQKIIKGQDELIARHRALIMSFVNTKGKALNESDREDLEQDGYLGLLNATDRYNFRLGNCYMTFAYYRVRQNIDSSLSLLKNIRIPINIMSKISRLTIKEKQLIQKLGHIPTKQQLADEMNISVETLNELQFLKKSGTTSYDSKIREYEDSECYSDTIADTSQKDAWEIINEEQNRKTIGLLLKKLKPQARKVIELRYGFNNCEPHTRDEIGDLLGISRERVRQIENETIRRMMKNTEILKIFGEQKNLFAPQDFVASSQKAAEKNNESLMQTKSLAPKRKRVVKKSGSGE